MIVPHCKSNLCCMDLLANSKLPDAYDHFLFIPLDHGKNNHLSCKVNGHKILKARVGHILPHRDKPAIEAVLRERIEKVFKQRLIAYSHRPEKDLYTRLCCSMSFQSLRIFPSLSWYECLIPEDKVEFFGFFDQPGSESWMGDRD